MVEVEMKIKEKIKSYEKGREEKVIKKRKRLRRERQRKKK